MKLTAAELDADLTALAKALFADIEKQTKDGPGVTRPSYGEAETRALKALETAAQSHGIDCHYDRAANLWFELPNSPSGPATVIGSHLDSVPQGGNFDGLAGVIAGLLVLLHLKQTGVVPFTPIKVLALRGEESAWFGKAYMGSLALIGKLSATDLELEHRETGQTLGSAMADLGIPIDEIKAGKPLMDLTAMGAYLELHIEQGPTMVARRWPVSPVTGIRGNMRHNRIVCKGETGHSGAVPRWLRKDAVLAVA